MSFKVFKRPPSKRNEFAEIIEALIDAGEGYAARTDVYPNQVQSLRRHAKLRGFNLRSYTDSGGNIVVYLVGLREKSDD